jgi:hypothetical protein
MSVHPTDGNNPTPPHIALRNQVSQLQVVRAIIFLAYAYFYQLIFLENRRNCQNDERHIS